MNKTDLINAIMEQTTGFKKSHLTKKDKDELETIYAELNATEESVADAAPETTTPEETTNVQTEAKTDTSAPDALESKMLAFIPKLADFTGTDSEMQARAFLKVAEDDFNLPLETCRKLFWGLHKKGYYTTKGKAEGKTRTTFQLTVLGVQYLTDNNLLTAPAADAAPEAEASTEEKFNAKIWLDDLKADYGNVTSEILDELVATEILTRSQAEEIYDLSNKAA